MFGGVLLGFEPKSIQSAPGPTNDLDKSFIETRRGDSHFVSCSLPPKTFQFVCEGDHCSYKGAQEAVKPTIGKMHPFVKNNQSKLICNQSKTPTPVWRL